MKSILLAAGLGTRLRPLTNHIPKCLVPIQGKPLLAYWIEKLVYLGVTDILVNTHYFSEKVEAFIKSSPHRDKVTLVYENVLLGTGGTLINNKDFWKDSSTLVIHADNYCEDSLEEFILAHHNRPSQCEASLLIFETQRPQQCGIVEVNKNGIITAFHEKVPHPPSNLASGALFLFSDSIYSKYLSDFKSNEFYEISIDFIPLLIQKLHAYKVKGLYEDIGTPEALLSLENALSAR